MQVGPVRAQRQHQQREEAEHEGRHDRRAGPVPPEGEVARTGDERRQQRREQRGAEGGEAADVGATGRVEPQFLRRRPVVADGRALDGRPAAPPRGCARRRRRASCGERRSVGPGERAPWAGRRAPGGSGAAAVRAGRRGAPRRGPRWAGGGRASPPAAGRRSRAARRVSAGFRRSAGARRHGRRSAGHLTRAGRGGVRAAGGGPPRPAVAPALGGVAATACGGLPAGGTGPGAPAGGAFRCGGWGAGDGGATASPASGSRARPRWSPPGPPRDDTYGFDGAAAAAETRDPAPQRLPGSCRGGAPR